MMSKFLEEAVQRGWWVMKMDIQSFFMGIRKSVLADRLEDFIRREYQNQRKLEDLVWLSRVITLLDPTSNSPANLYLPENLCLIFLVTLDFLLVIILLRYLLISF